MPRTPGLHPNMAAFLDMLASSEGTTKHGEDDGCNVLVGGTLFNSYEDHPHKLVKLNANLSSTAAGRYQLLSKYFDVYKKQLHLANFSPVSQDAIAIQQIKECKAVTDIEAGRLYDAIKKCAHIWASLPGANYGQHENTLATLEDAYTGAGGAVV
jgi:muramidase (phage lysozyme)